MRPMLSWEVIEGEQNFFVLLQAFAGFWEFGLVTSNELIVRCQSCLARRRQLHFMNQLFGIA